MPFSETLPRTPALGNEEALTGSLPGAVELSGALALADTLAWAARHGIPFAQAVGCVSTLSGRRRTGGVPALERQVALLARFVFPLSPHPVRYDWSVRTRLLAADLEAGASLSAALGQHFRRRLPRYYLTAVEHGERVGRLPTILPVLAERLSLPMTLRSAFAAAVCYGFVRLVATMATLLFLAVFIIPKFHEVFEELGGASPFAAGLLFQTAVGLLWWGTITGFVVYGLWRYAPWGDYLVVHLPLLGTIRRRHLLAEAAREMGIFVAGGSDLREAAQLTESSTRSTWMCRRLRRFADALDAGEHWIAAWDRMGLGSPLADWVLRNAALREAPADGFNRVADWLSEQNLQRITSLATWLEHLSLFLIAAVVAALGIYTFGSLTSILYTLM